MLQVSISLVVTLHLRPLRSTANMRSAEIRLLRQALILSDVTTNLTASDLDHSA